MRGLEALDLFLGPGVEGTVHAPQLDAERGIVLDQIRLDGMCGQSADGGEPILRRGRLHGIEQGAQKFRRHGADQLVAVLTAEGFEHVLAHGLRSRREILRECGRRVVAGNRGRHAARFAARDRADLRHRRVERGLVCRARL
jgi:hypothetical protein